MNEAFGATKMVKVRGLEQIYTNKFSITSKIIALNLALASSIAQLPRFFRRHCFRWNNTANTYFDGAIKF